MYDEPWETAMHRPFPGMDPYLEAPDLWTGVHVDLLFAITEDLQPQLVPRYVASKEQRVAIRKTKGAVGKNESRISGVVLGRRARLALPEVIEVPEMRRSH